MKKLRVLLSAMAILLAIGGVFANEMFFTQIPGYYWVNTSPNPTCVQDGLCENAPGTDCINAASVPLGFSSVVTGTGQCGTLLQKIQ